MSTARRRPDSRCERLDPACGIQELAEAHGAPLSERPHVDERNVEHLARTAGDARVAPEHDDVGARVEVLLGCDDERVPPVPVERVEDVAANLVEPVLDAAVRETLRLVPFDVVVHVLDHRIQVAECKRGI